MTRALHARVEGIKALFALVSQAQRDKIRGLVNEVLSEEDAPAAFRAKRRGLS